MWVISLFSNTGFKEIEKVMELMGVGEWRGTGVFGFPKEVSGTHVDEFLFISLFHES